MRELAIDTVTICYKSGATLKEIAATFGVHPTTIMRWLRKAGIPIRHRGRPRSPHSK